MTFLRRPIPTKSGVRYNFIVVGSSKGVFWMKKVHIISHAENSEMYLSGTRIK